jgi:eukaryotic-like serine/threonine-protein kinase
MGSVYLGRHVQAGSKAVAIKGLHPHLCRNAEFVTMLLDEARLVRCVEHPNVVRMIELIEDRGELFLVMEYVHGETLSGLYRRLPGQRPPPGIAVAIMLDALLGLDAAHRAVSETGAPLGLVHRDISPQNIIVGVDGSARILDFGVAKAAGRIHQTREGVVKGKLPYMPPEMLKGAAVSQSIDTYAAGVILWELLSGQPLFAGENDALTIGRVFEHKVRAPSLEGAVIPKELDAVVLRALARSPQQRFASAREFHDALSDVYPRARPVEVAEWLKGVAITRLTELDALQTQMETGVIALPDSSERPTLGPMAAHGAEQASALESSIEVQTPSVELEWASSAHRIGIRGAATNRAKVFFVAGIAALSMGFGMCVVSPPPGVAAVLGERAPNLASELRQGQELRRVLRSGESAAKVVLASPTGRESPPRALGPGLGNRLPASGPKGTPQPAKKAQPAAANTARPALDRSSCYAADRTGTIHIRPECL